MTIELVPARNPEDISELANLAEGIWMEYWPSHIGEPQTRYMIDKFQSEGAIKRDMDENSYEYWFVKDGGRVVGYTGGHVDNDTNRFFISKVYLLEDERGKGFASSVIRFYEGLCEQRGLDAMYLTVNKHNDLAIRAYLAKGFEAIDAVETDIGGGFVMDDFIMEKRLRCSDLDA